LRQRTRQELRVAASRHPCTSTKSPQGWFSLAPGPCPTSKADRALPASGGRTAGALLLQTLTAAPVQQAFSCPPVPRALSILPISMFFSVSRREPSVAAVPSLAAPISAPTPSPVTLPSSVLRTKHRHFAKSQGLGNTVKTRHRLGHTQGRNNTGTNTKRDFHSSKCLGEQRVEANEADPQTDLLHLGCGHHNRHQTRGSPRCTAAPEIWGLPTSLDVCPQGKNLRSNCLASSTSFLSKSWESRKAEGWPEVQRHSLPFAPHPDVLRCASLPGQPRTGMCLQIRPSCCGPAAPPPLGKLLIRYFAPAPPFTSNTGMAVGLPESPAQAL